MTKQIHIRETSPDPQKFLDCLANSGRQQITAIAAISSNAAIGARGGLPWDIPEDVVFFESVVAGCALLVGRLTYHTMPRVPPDTFVVSRERDMSLSPCARRVDNVEEGLSRALSTGKPVFVIGGSGIYQAAWPYCHNLILTRVHAEFEGDAFFPASIDYKNLPIVHAEQHSFVERRSGHAVTCEFSCFVHEKAGSLPI